MDVYLEKFRTDFAIHLSTIDSTLTQVNVLHANMQESLWLILSKAYTKLTYSEQCTLTCFCP